MPDPQPASTETVQRPEPGLARGRWEAPPSAFYLTLAAVLVGALAWLLVTVRKRRRPR